MASAPRDDNRNAGLVAKSDADNTPVILEADPATKRLKVNATITGGGSYPSNVISTVNSSTTPLAANGVFTGTSEDVSAYADIRVTVFSDVASATDGLSMQQSQDGTNWDQTDLYTIAASTGKAFDVPVYAKFFRIVYTNGNTIQAAFRLQAVFHISRTKPSSQRPMDARGNDNDMEENLAYNMSYNVSGNNWNRSKDIGVAGIPAAGISDGTNTANVVAGDTGFNGVATAAAGNTAGFSINSVTTSTPVNCEGYAWVIVQYTTVGTGVIIAGQFSNDGGTTWTSASSWQAFNSTSNANTGISGAAGMYASPSWGKLFRLNVTVIGSGTQAGNIYLTNTPRAFSTMQMLSAQSGPWTMGGVVTGTTGTITTNASAITSTVVPGTASGGLALISTRGTYAGISFGITASDDTGTTFYNVPIYDVAANQWLAPGSTITPGTNASKLYWVPVSPANQQIKVLASAYTSGTGNIRISYGTVPGSAGSTMAQLMDAAGNNRGVNVDAANNLTVSQYAATSTLTNVASSASTVSLLASNTAAKSRIIYNDSTQVLYIKYGTTASTTSYTVQVAANGYFEFPQPTYTGAVDGIWASANGNARITEVA